MMVYDGRFWLFSQVFSVNNVNVVIRTRTEHLTDEEKARIKSWWKILFMYYITVYIHIFSIYTEKENVLKLDFLCS